MIAATQLADVYDTATAAGVDACTLNNALNVVQLYVLVLIVRRLRWTLERESRNES